MPVYSKSPVCGLDNPHPLSRMKTELVWEGKYDEYGNRRPVKLPTTPIPLQRIEESKFAGFLDKKSSPYASLEWQY